MTTEQERSALAAMIDHTLLRPDATEADILRLCREARTYRVASACVNAGWTGTVAKALSGSGVRTCAVIGFPLGAGMTGAKAAETRLAVEAGAEEIDMVINIGRARMNDFTYVEADIRAVVEAAGKRALVKVILETCLLDDAQKIAVCRAAKSAGAQFVKTSTGFSTGGATAADVALLRRTVGPDMGVKASGGIRTCETALEMAAAGATRIGASATKAILGL